MHKENDRNEGKLAVEQGREYWANPSLLHLSISSMYTTPPTTRPKLNPKALSSIIESNCLNRAFDFLLLLRQVKINGIVREASFCQNG